MVEQDSKQDFPNLAKAINSHIQEGEQIPNRIHPKKSMPRHIIIKLLKTKDRENLNIAKNKTKQNKNL